LCGRRLEPATDGQVVTPQPSGGPCTGGVSARRSSVSRPSRVREHCPPTGGRLETLWTARRSPPPSPPTPTSSPFAGSTYAGRLRSQWVGNGAVSAHDPIAGRHPRHVDRRKLSRPRAKAPPHAAGEYAALTGAAQFQDREETGEASLSLLPHKRMQPQERRLVQDGLAACS
jgi:hypothetical protein